MLGIFLESDQNSPELFLEILGKNYQILFGVHPNRNEDLDFRLWVNYIFFTVGLNIICLNLLIAILSNTYSNVQATLGSTDCRTKAEMIHEICILMFWKRGKNELVYLHFVNNIGDKLMDRIETNEWDSRVKNIEKKLDALQ